MKKEAYFISLLLVFIMGCGSNVEDFVSVEDFFLKTPSVVSVYPSNLEKNVSLKTDITITAIFDKDMDSKTITDNTFIIKDSKGNIDGAVTYSDRKANFKPNIDLEANTTYTASITKEVKDSIGNNISAEYSWAFTTGSDTNTPSIPDGVKAIPEISQITISWNIVPEATSYNIYWSTTSGVTKTIGTKISNVISPYIHTGRINGKAYYYVVTSVNSYGESGESAEVTETPVSDISLPKTGQTTCYDSSGNVIACTGTGQDGEIQAGVAWPDPRFIDNGNGTVTDKLTGLIWTKDANLMINRDPKFDADWPAGDGGVTWQHALDYVAKLNAEVYLGFADWRLPNVNELESLVNAGQANTATWLNTLGFNNVQSLGLHDYWSSTSSAVDTSEAWIVGMLDGHMSFNAKFLTGYYVWPVRSGQSGLVQLWETGQKTCYSNSGNVIACAGTGQDGDIRAGVAWPSPRFTDNGDGTVTDDLTGLMWAKDANLMISRDPIFDADWTGDGGVTWQHAFDYITKLNSEAYLGYTDWHLPNRKELHSLNDFSQYNQALPPGHPFVNVLSYPYLSSTSYVHSMGYAWIVSMWYGNMFNFEHGHVWPVRSGSSSVSVSSSPPTGLILSENFEDGTLDNRITIEKTGSFNSAPGIKDITNFGSKKAFGYGMSTCVASCFNNYVTNFKITFPEPTFVSSISFKEMELYSNWGSHGEIYIDGTAVGTYGRQPSNDWQADTIYRSTNYSVNKVATTIKLQQRLD